MKNLSILLTLFILLSNYSFAQSECIDTDGDGWGWDGKASCEVRNTGNNAPNNSQAANSNAAPGECIDHDGDGWGWDGKASCVVGSTGNTASNNPQATNSNTTPPGECVDHDGDGWGWDGKASCRPDASQNSAPPSTAPSNISQAAPDGSINNPYDESQTPTCEDVDGDGDFYILLGTTPFVCDPKGNVQKCSDFDGDGQGTRFYAQKYYACDLPGNPNTSTPTTIPTTLPNNQPTASTQPPTLTGPVVVDNASVTTTQPTATAPIETTTEPAEEIVNIRRSCPALSPGQTIVSSTKLKSNQTVLEQCVGKEDRTIGRYQYGELVRFGDFAFSNNAFNARVSTADWYQCLNIENKNGNNLPTWTYDWGNEDDLIPGEKEWAVKGYPEVIYGVKSENELSGNCSATGLPIAYKDLPEISINYKYDAPITNLRSGDFGDENNNPEPVQGGDRNVAIESFFHESCDIRRRDNENKTFEIMVWLEVGPERYPSGSGDRKGTFKDSSGNEFIVYGKKNDPEYVAYVSEFPLNQRIIKWNDFIEDVRSNSETYGANKFKDSWCMANILFGTEIWWGEGSMDLQYLTITSKGK